MASKIRIFRSTGATAPSSLEYGELAVTVEDGTAGTSANKAGRLFIGNASGNPVELGGEYTYKLMDHAHGSLINSSVAIVDSNGQIDGWNVAGILTATRTNITDLVSGNLNITGVATFAQGLNLNGDVTIGDSHTDTHTVNSRSGFNTDATFNNAILVTGISTFSGLVDSNGGANVSGGAGLVVSADGANVTGVSTFNSAVLFQSSIDVDGQAIFDDITVSAASTFTGAIDANGGANVAGGGGLVVSGDGINVTGVSTFNDNVTVGGNLNVQGHSEFVGVVTFKGGTINLGDQDTDDINVAGEFISNLVPNTDDTYDIGVGDKRWRSANFSGISTFNNVTVGGASTALLVNGNARIVGVLTIGAASITFSGVNNQVTGITTFTGFTDFNEGINVDGHTELDNLAVSGVSTFSGLIEANAGVDATDVVGTAGTFTTAFTLGSGGTKYTLPVADGSVDQILVTDGAGTLSFQDVPSSMVISAGAAGTDRVNLLTDTFTVASTNNETRTTLTDNTITVGLATDIIVGGGVTISNDLLVLGNLTVEGTETIINVERLDVQDKTIGVASTATASNTTANGGGFFVHAGSDGDKTIFWNLTQGGFEVNQDWLPESDGSLDLGNASREWQNLFVDGLAELDDVNVSAAATINTLNVTGTGTIATADINGGNIDGTVIGAASSAAATLTTVNYTSLTGGDITATGSRVTAGDVTFTNLRVTGVSTVADLFLSTGTNTNGVAFFDASGQVTSTATPSAGIQTSNFILTTNAAGVPSWTDTIDGGQF